MKSLTLKSFWRLVKQLNKSSLEIVVWTYFKIKRVLFSKCLTLADFTESLEIYGLIRLI